MTMANKSNLIKECDRVFSIAVRKENADQNGFVQCATCISIKHWSQMTCGHYRKRRHMTTRWLLKNCAPQCMFCNGELQGNDIKFEEYITKHHGYGAVDELVVLSNKEKHFTADMIKQLIEQFRKML